MPENVTAFLTSRGWDMSAPADICSLDCAEPGYLKTAVVGGKRCEIILCPADALELEDGAWEGDYSGALTPADSRATEFPWVELAAA